MRGELEIEQNCNLLTPTLLTITAFLSPFSWAAQPGAWGLSLCKDMVFIRASSLQLTRTSCRRGYIIIWLPPTSCERHNWHSIQPLDSQGRPWYLRPDAPVIYTGAFLLLTAWPSRRSICNILVIYSNTWDHLTLMTKLNALK